MRHLTRSVVKVGANMGEVIRFVSKSERERIRLIREARAIYDSVFPPAVPVNEQSETAPLVHAISGGGRPSCSRTSPPPSSFLLPPNSPPQPPPPPTS